MLRDVPEDHRDNGPRSRFARRGEGTARSPAIPARKQPRRTPGHVVGLPSVGTACAFSGSLRGFELVSAKQCYLIPPTSGERQPLGANIIVGFS
ncbi:MAG TPA: hypothetical protein VK909_05655 [Anaerolineales bacterium]|nr:hypothetical protein [Anaerolineales bacterium]